ncbi:hypothetical protein Z946_1068 [Sulfitobacter noctilucicola]|nr:hypothetical protein Z946_1068 [Sulfitobacter noctilucicola]
MSAAIQARPLLVHRRQVKPCGQELAQICNISCQHLADMFQNTLRINDFATKSTPMFKRP